MIKSGWLVFPTLWTLIIYLSCACLNSSFAVLSKIYYKLFWTVVTLLCCTTRTYSSLWLCVVLVIQLPFILPNFNPSLSLEVSSLLSLYEVNSSRYLNKDIWQFLFCLTYFNIMSSSSIVSNKLWNFILLIVEYILFIYIFLIKVLLRFYENFLANWILIINQHWQRNFLE